MNNPRRILQTMALALGTAIAVSACASTADRLPEGSKSKAALEEYIAKREAVFDGLAEIVVAVCEDHYDETGVNACDDGRIDLDAWGDDLPPELEGARGGYCGLVEEGGTYAAVARAVVIARVNYSLRKRGVPVFAAGVCRKATAAPAPAYGWAIAVSCLRSSSSAPAACAWLAPGRAPA